MLSSIHAHLIGVVVGDLKVLRHCHLHVPRPLRKLSSEPCSPANGRRGPSPRAGTPHLGERGGVHGWGAGDEVKMAGEGAHAGAEQGGVDAVTRGALDSGSRGNLGCQEQQPHAETPLRKHHKARGTQQQAKLQQLF